MNDEELIFDELTLLGYYDIYKENGLIYGNSKKHSILVILKDKEPSKEEFNELYDKYNNSERKLWLVIPMESNLKWVSKVY